MKKIAVLFSGKGSNLAHIIKHLHEKKVYEVVLALTNNPKAEGISFALDAGIPVEVVDSSVYSNREIFDTIVVEHIQRYQAHLTILAGFMRILTPVFTEQVVAINLHPSLLPRHKGLHAIEKSYEDSFVDGGVSVHEVSSELDGGRIVLQQKIGKAGLSFDAYDVAIRQMEKEVLIEAIKEVLER